MTTKFYVKNSAGEYASEGFDTRFEAEVDTEDCALINPFERFDVSEEDD